MAIYKTKNTLKKMNLDYSFRTNSTLVSNSEMFSLLYADTTLQKYYKNIVCQDLCLKQDYKNIMECVSLNKIVCNTSSKHYAGEKESILPAFTALEMITGQKPKYTCAKKSISTFKLRQNQILGCKNSLRGNTMYRFLEKYISIVSTRIKDWSENYSSSNKSNSLTTAYNKDYVVLNSNLFPELQQHDELFQNVTGIEISFSTLSNNVKTSTKTSRYKKDGILLYSAFQMPK
uniref:Large ribosomal subunit protein uL5m n=1 Tax=Prototheca wickerhamii TaxID=3111 RepID=RM05_PROWI|nr:ribosomal protein L5 [Prototheca wickerhamii]P46749.1 RecName: Full=Large ribosomal subunit protein uL5m; AltName: Full=60S ribosomal protein L5, mitochondrial [Prototheca wickerhamii]AAD12648.1 ribosomal protein L5 [Prototheca wickerhamii]